MSRFNTPKSIASAVGQAANATTNPEGGLAFKMTPEMELYSTIVVSMVGKDDSFYEAGSDRVKRLRELIQKCRPEFVAQLAIYTREQMKLRSATTFLLGELCNIHNGMPGIRQYVSRGIKRADDITELLAYQAQRNNFAPRKSKFPNAMKNGVGEAFGKFDHYKLAKYKRTDLPLTLRDAMRISHPKPHDENRAALYKSLIDGTMPPAMTWEVMRSTGKMTWDQVVDEIFSKDNYMALLRNVRNILENCSPAQRQKLPDLLRNEEQIRRAHLLPYRFYTAYKAIREADLPIKDLFERKAIYSALNDALKICFGNLPRFDGKSVIAIDTSGSMTQNWISKKEDRRTGRTIGVRCSEIAMLYGIMASNYCENAITCNFDTDVNWHNFNISDPLEHAYTYQAPGNATFGYKVIKYLTNNNVKVDRLFFLTDMILYPASGIGNGRTGLIKDGKYPYDLNWDDLNTEFAVAWAEYNVKYPSSKMYVWDMRGYGMSAINPDLPNNRLVSGYSDRAFEMITKLEARNTDVICEIMNYGKTKINDDDIQN